MNQFDGLRCTIDDLRPSLSRASALQGIIEIIFANLPGMYDLDVGEGFHGQNPVNFLFYLAWLREAE